MSHYPDNFSGFLPGERPILCAACDEPMDDDGFDLCDRCEAAEREEREADQRMWDEDEADEQEAA